MREKHCNLHSYVGNQLVEEATLTQYSRCLVVLAIVMVAIRSFCVVFSLYVVFCRGAEKPMFVQQI